MSHADFRDILSEDDCYKDEQETYKHYVFQHLSLVLKKT